MIEFLGKHFETKASPVQITMVMPANAGSQITKNEKIAPKIPINNKKLIRLYHNFMLELVFRNSFSH